MARDVGTVLDNFQQQVKGIVGLLDELVVLIGEAATAFQKWVRPILVEQFGDGVGGFLADAVTLYTDVQVGAVTGLIGTVSGAVALADPDTWKGMAELALSVAQDPSTLPGVLSNMGKEFVAWDTWSGDHPGRAAGEAAFNIGSLFVPGGALSKTGSVAKGLTLTRRVLDEGRLPQLGELGGWTRATNVDNLGSTPRVPEVPPVRPGAIPGPTQPSAPTGAGAGRAEGGPGQRAPMEQPGRGSGPPPAATGLPPAFHDGATSIGDHPATPDTTSVQAGPSDYAPSGPDIAAELNDAFIRGDSTSALAREVADLSTHRIPSPTGDFAQEDRVVLGKWDGMDGGYIGEARHNGGIYYDTGDLTWDAMRAGLDDGQTRRLGWEINEQFLRTQLENGVSRIEYVLPPDFGSVEQLAAVQRLSFSAMEINFLKSNAAAFGYVQHGNTWIREGAGSQ
ncbi:hypothetical protein C6A85_000000106685 [Mycobacterium sp. ITM-2017-0098]|nr:hypothetical protein C6A85_000000106685 [Mycobacterium sp. ITM-2017-0098]